MNYATGNDTRLILPKLFFLRMSFLGRFYSKRFYLFFFPKAKICFTSVRYLLNIFLKGHPQLTGDHFFVVKLLSSLQ